MTTNVTHIFNGAAVASTNVLDMQENIQHWKEHGFEVCIKQSFRTILQHPELDELVILELAN